MTEEAIMKHLSFLRRRRLLCLLASTPSLLVLSPLLGSALAGASSQSPGSSPERLRQLEKLAEGLGVSSVGDREREREKPGDDPDAFRNMKARALLLIDNLESVRTAGAQQAIDQVAEFLRQIHSAERSIPSAEERAAALKPAFDDKIRAEYRNLFDSCTVRPKYKSAVQRDRERIMKNQPRYEKAQKETQVPWYVIGVAHNMEASFNFSGHLHNGDDIRFKTVNVPKGRPRIWDPPKSSKDWEISADDALEYDAFAGQTDWSIERLLYRLEGYNGWGPRQVHKMNTPYLWSFSTSYEAGKYDADGHWNSTLVSDQCGAAVLLKALVDAGDVQRPPNWHA
jgi:lysozyme family protein